MKIVNPVAIKGENIAVSYLQKKGYRILTRNFRKQYGEIDIIATHQNTLVFIEVKTRTSKEFGEGIEAISYFKLKSLIKTGLLYTSLHSHLPEALRVDAISVLLSKSGELLDIEHTENIGEVV